MTNEKKMGDLFAVGLLCLLAAVILVVTGLFGVENALMVAAVAAGLGTILMVADKF